MKANAPADLKQLSALLLQGAVSRRWRGGDFRGPVDSSFGCLVTGRPLRPRTGRRAWDAQQDRRIETDAERDAI